MPIALRVNLDPSLRLALLAFCDVAVKQTDGAHVANISAMSLAAILHTSQNAARKLRDRLRNAGFVERGTRQSEWIVRLPSTKAVNDVVQRSYAGLGGAASSAPIVSKKWNADRREYPENRRYPREKEVMEGHFPGLKSGPTGALSSAKKRLWQGTKEAMEGHFQSSAYIGVNNRHGGSSLGPTENATDLAVSHRDAEFSGKLADEGLPIAAHNEVDEGRS